jgi:hypothetical protein
MRNKYNVTNKKGQKTSKQEDEFVDYMRSLGYEFETQKKFILQEKFEFYGETHLAITYTPDLYFPEDKLAIDYKGSLTDVYKIKKKMFIKKYGIKLVEVRRVPNYMFKATGYRYATINSIENCKDVRKRFTGSNKDIEHNTVLEINRIFNIIKHKGYVEVKFK